MMTRLTRALVARWLERLLHTHDTPQRTAAAFGLGVFLGFSPFVGLHTVMGLALAFLFDLNRVAVLAGVYTNLPWFMGPYYAVATLVGALILGVDVPAESLEGLRSLFRDWGPRAIPRVATTLESLAWSYALGSTLLAAALAVAAYAGSLRFIRARRRHLARRAS